MTAEFMDIQTSYDRVAGEYAARIYGELAHKPLDRAWLDKFATQVRPLGLACDMGCGPGQVARYLRDQGLNVIGVDLSPGMVKQAQQLNPDIVFSQGSMLALDFVDASWGGIVAFYSIIHIPRQDVIQALREMRRVLCPQGRLLLAFHLGQTLVHTEELFGEKVSIDFVFFQRIEMEGYLQAAGFAIEEAIERDPYPDVEYQGRRAYILARNVEGNE